MTHLHAGQSNKAMFCGLGFLLAEFINQLMHLVNPCLASKRLCCRPNQHFILPALCSIFYCSLSGRLNRKTLRKLCERPFRFCRASTKLLYYISLIKINLIAFLIAQNLSKLFDADKKQLRTCFQVTLLCI